ncbi:MAG: hypothetical protein AAF211_03090 [Myxococcota bacterium]
MSRRSRDLRVPSLPTLALLAVGCAEETVPEPVPFADQLLWLEVTPEASAPTCERTIEHTFADAVVIGQSDGTANEIDRRLRSSDGFYAYVTRQAAGGLLLNFGGNVFTGDFVDAATLDVAWRRSAELEESTNVPGQYLYQAVGAELTEEVLSLAATDDSAAVFEGTMTVRDFADIDYVETDEWEANASGIFLSSVPAAEYLEPGDGFGTVFNSSFQPECTEEGCQLSVLSDCTASFSLTAYPLVGGIEAFDALDDYRRVEDDDAPPRLSRQGAKTPSRKVIRSSRAGRATVSKRTRSAVSGYHSR